jgi:hypothetical protein
MLGSPAVSGACRALGRLQNSIEPAKGEADSKSAYPQPAIRDAKSSASAPRRHAQAPRINARRTPAGPRHQEQPTLASFVQDATFETCSSSYVRQ